MQAKIGDLVDDLAETRWLLTEQSESSIQAPFLLVVVLWLGIISDAPLQVLLRETHH